MQPDPRLKQAKKLLEKAVIESKKQGGTLEIEEVQGCCIVHVGGGSVPKGRIKQSKCEAIADQIAGATVEFRPGEDC